MEKMIAAVKRILLNIVSDQGLYLLAAFVFAAVLNSSIFVWYRQQIDVVNGYMIIPWGAALCVLRLMRASERDLRSADTGLLTLMFAWVVAPFLLRFGFTFNNVTNWYGHAVAFFAIYAMTREDAPQRRGAVLDRVCAGFALISFIWGGVLLLCAVTGTAYSLQEGGEVFGVTLGTLQSGLHYNHTGMHAVSCAMMCLVGVSRRKHVLARILHLIPALMMVLVIVLTQSRTARYSTLLAFAVGAYGAALARLNLRSRVMRHGAAIVTAVAVLAAGYIGADRITDAALAHYSGEAPWVSTAGAEAAQPQAQAQPSLQAREAVDATFSDRTIVWKNLFELWKNEPKYMVIGNGIGRTGSRIVQGTIHEAGGAVAVHNAYLQLVADFGLIGAAITLAFFLVVFFPAFRVFLARGDAAYGGGRALCMLVVAVLATGMMESQPLGAMSPMNMVLYYALAVLCAEGRALNGKK